MNYKAYITQKTSEWFIKETKLRPSAASDSREEYNVVVDTSQRFQTHMGFGAAITDAAVCAMDVLDESGRREVIEALFSPSGLGYNMARLPMHTTDFSPSSYTYIREGDKALDTFDVSCDEKRFELYLDCKACAGELFTVVATWSPPAFMKDNNTVIHGGRLLPEYRGAWAEYYCRFIEALAERGIETDALTVQNEPEAVQRWESCLYSATEEAEFIRDCLCPALRSHSLDGVKIMLWDHNRDGIVRRTRESFSVEGVRDLVWGVAYHWYCSDKSDNLSTVHALFPEKALLLTECCVELAYDSTTGAQSYAGLWEHGERYGKQIIDDFNNYSQGWIDWNMCLDEQGGPNYAGNYCEAPIMIDRKTKKIMYMSSYYYIGHFSKFIKPGAVRVYCGNDAPKQLSSVAYVNPDGKKIAVIMNTASRNRSIALTVDGETIKFELRRHAIVTLVID